MLALTVALSMQLGAADLRPEAWVVVTRRSGVARPQALELARALSTALTERGVPNPTPPDEDSTCNAKVPCLVDLAQKKGVAVLVTVEAGSALDDVVLHCEALSVDEFGKKLSTFDFTGAAKGFSANVKEKVEEFFAPAVRGVLGIGAPVAATPEVKPEPKPEEKPAVVAEAPKPVETVTRPAEVQSSGFTTTKYLGIVAMGVGAALLITSAVLGGLTLSSAGTFHSACASNPCTNPAAYTAFSSAGTTQGAGIGVLIPGIVLAAAGAVLFFVDFGGGSSGTVTPSVSGDGLSLVFAGHF